MRFWERTFLFGAIILASILLQVLAPSIGYVEVNLSGYCVQIQNYALITGLLVVIFTCGILKAVYRLGRRCFIWIFGNRTDGGAANSMAALILADKHEFLPLAMRTMVPNHLRIIKTAIILLRESDKFEVMEETDVQIVNIHIIKQHIRKLLRQRDIAKSIKLIERALGRYARYVTVIQDEILEVAVNSKKNNIKFYFDPRRFKYNLASSFVEKYYVSLALLEFSIEHNNEAKLKVLEKVFSNYPSNYGVAITLLEFILEHEQTDSLNKKVIDIIKQVFALNPNRTFANYLLKVNRKDLFEVAQTIVQPVAETNIERVWFMLIISIKLHLLAKAKEIIRQYLADKMYIADLSQYYVQNYSELSQDSEIIEIITEICNEN
ncbi:MAG: hypothetical protein LBL32_03005 [Holosporales bacterium]|jgi:hypothetical protein|nr:hypothetical protein [Holosporales bacterium]